MFGLPFAREVLPFFVGALALFGAPALLCWLFKKRRAAGVLLALAILSAGYMLYFFRDPPRTPPDDPRLVLAGADGRVMSVTRAVEKDFIKGPAVRISIFLSLFDVHINRAPIAGRVMALGYHPGKRYFTFQEKSSEYNQHSTILIDGVETRCLVKQIVGPVARRVVYWLNLYQDVDEGERIGMMKFGSRLDMFLPAEDVEVLIQPGAKVQAGLTPVARLITPAGKN